VAVSEGWAGWFMRLPKGGEVKVARGMSADAIADVVSTYARPLGWDLSPHDLRRTFAKLARSGLAPLEQIQLGSELDLVDAACDRFGIRLSSSS